MLYLVDIVFNGMKAAMFAHVILSWLHTSPVRPRWVHHPIARWIDDTGSLLLRPFRMLLDRTGISSLTKPLDLSPVAALLILNFVQFLIGICLR